MRFVWFSLVVTILLLSPAWARPPLTPLARLSQGESAPTEVGFDTQGHTYVLFGREGLLDVYDGQGRRLERRGGKAEGEGGPERVQVVSQWVGRLAKSLLLARDPEQGLLEWVLIPGQQLDILRLTGAPTQLEGLGAIARDLEGRIFVYHEQSHAVYAFGGSSGRYQSVIRLGGDPIRPRQLAVDSQHNLYILGRDRLHVFRKDGALWYSQPDVTAFYLTGTDRLAVAGEGFIRRYHRGGGLEFETTPPPEAKEWRAEAIALNDQSDLTVYYRDGFSGEGTIVKLRRDGVFQGHHPQPIRFPTSPDPGYRLDYQKRLHLWNAERNRALKAHPNGQVERDLVYSPQPAATGQMALPTDMVVGKDGTVWIADPSNFRIQRFQLGKGWLKPIPVGVKDRAPRAHPRHLALTSQGYLMSIVYPLNNRGDVYLQRRDPNGRLLAQLPVGTAAGDPVVKAAVSPNGDFFVYHSGGPGENPRLKRFTARGSLIASVGGEEKNFFIPGQFTSQIALNSAEDLLPWRGGLLIPYHGRFLYVDENLRVTEARDFEPPRGSQLPDFAGSTILKNKLYLADTANRCVYKILLED